VRLGVFLAHASRAARGVGAGRRRSAALPGDGLIAPFLSLLLGKLDQAVAPRHEQL